MKKVIYINSYANKSHHELFNSALLAALSLHFKIKCYSGRESRENILKILKEEKFETQSFIHTNINLFLIKGDSAFAVLVRHLFSAIYNIWILLLSKKEEVLVYNYNNPLSLCLLNKINSFLKRKVLVFCHSEIELLVANEGGILAKILRRSIRSFFLKNRDVYLNFCVLGDSITRNLKPIIGNKIDYFTSIDHPYFFKKEQFKKQTGKLVFATIGSLNPFKGLNLYLKLLDLIEGGEQKYMVIGQVTEKKDEFVRRGVDIKQKDSKKMDREVFEKAISKVDYILFFYSKEKYKLTASGAIFDAINNRRPIIALKNDYFSYLFDKYGSIGFLCNDIFEMKENIERLSHLKNIENSFDYSHYIENLSVKSFASKVKAKIEEIKI